MKKIIQKLNEIERTQCKRHYVFSYKIREKVSMLIGGLGNLDVKTTNCLHVYVFNKHSLNLNEFVFFGSNKEILQSLENVSIEEEGEEQ